MLPSPIRWSKSLYHQMAEFGWFRDKRVQLIEGEIIEMAPMGAQHWVVVNTTYRTLIQMLPLEQYTISSLFVQSRNFFQQCGSSKACIVLIVSTGFNRAGWRVQTAVCRYSNRLGVAVFLQ